MVTTIRSGFLKYEIVPCRNNGGGEWMPGSLDEQHALQFIGGLAQDPLNMVALRHIVWDDPAYPNATPWSDQEIVSRIARDIAWGRLAVVERSSSGIGNIPGSDLVPAQSYGGTGFNTADASSSGAPSSAAETVAASSAGTATLNPALIAFIADIKSDATYGSKVSVVSTVRSAERDARAVMHNQRNRAGYYKIFKINWQTAILDAVKGLNLKLPADYETAVQRLVTWELAGNAGPHVLGRAVDFGLAGGSSRFRVFLETEAKKRGFVFLNETSEGHYHVQM
jgi:hypothetical protein